MRFGAFFIGTQPTTSIREEEENKWVL